MTVESLDQVIMTVLSTSALAACITNGVQMIMIYVTIIFIYLLCMVLRRKRRPVWKKLFIAPLIATLSTFAFGAMMDGIFDIHIAYWVSVFLSSIVVVFVSKLCDLEYTVNTIKSLFYAFRGVRHDATDVKGGKDSE